METRSFRAIFLFLCVALVSLFAAAPPHKPKALSDRMTVDLSAPSSPSLVSPNPDIHASASKDEAAQARTVQNLGKLPLYFVENQGQLDERVAYYIQGSDKTIYFAPDGVTFALTAPLTPSASFRAGPTLFQREWERANSPRPNLRQKPEEGAIQRWSVKLDFIGANPNVRPIGQDKTAAIISYFKGPQDQWHAGLPTYGSIIYPDLWPGIDLVYYGTVNQLKYEFIVQPGVDLSQIRLAYRGADVSLDAQGQLLVTTPVGGFSDDTPVAYQEIDGQRVPVQMAYQTFEVSETSKVSALYGFQVGDYDPARPLILDPAVLVYCGYVGGSGSDNGEGIAVDSAGNTYVTGSTYSAEASFPVVVGPDLTYNGQYDVFVVKVNARGSGLTYAGYIGGNGDDEGYGIAVDSAGNAYVAGGTSSISTTFPVTGGLDLTFNGGMVDAFVAKVNPDGSSLVYAGYIGGNASDLAYGIAVDSAGNAYVAGGTSSISTTFPVTGGLDLTFNGGMVDAFVAKVNADGSGLVYAGYIGGNASDLAYCIAVDDAGNAYVTGSTDSTEATFPAVIGPDLTYNSSEDAFVAKVNAAGSGLVYAGYIGGSDLDEGTSVAVDSTGNAYVTGHTYSTEATFPVVGGPDLTFNGNKDAFVAKVNAAGSGLVYAGYIGGSGYDEGNGIAVDGEGNAYVTGNTDSTEATFPVVGGPDPTFNGGYKDAFVAKVMWYPAGIITAVDKHLERDGVPFEVRGTNYYPKDYAWDRFWINYTLALTQTNEELDRARVLGVNTVRIFLPYNLFDGTSQSAPYLGYLADFVSRLQVRDMVALVTLFDYYPTYSTQPYSTRDYIGSERHISSVLNTIGVTNTAVLAWDIKNELDRDYDRYGKSQVQAWATEMIRYTRGLDVDHLVTIGFHGVVTGTPCYTSTPGLVYSPTIAAELAPLVDVVSMHYFLSERCFESDLSALEVQAGEKPTLLEELGLHTQSSAPGSPHTETEQAAYYNALLSLSEAHGVAGYAFWTLNDFSYVLPGMPDSEKCMGVLRNSLVSTCQVTTTQDYTEKPAAETVRRHYAEQVAYLDLFDSWVDSNTDEPPAGWTDNGLWGGAYMRGYSPTLQLWSHDLGKVVLSKFVSNTLSITGTALSPLLANVNVDRYPTLAGQVYSYSIRDSLNGSDSTLYIGVKGGTQITHLLTITPGVSLPYTFSVDLRQPPLNWSGNRTFSIALQLVPQTGDGYSASYEFDWIGLLATPKTDFAAWPTVGIAPMSVAFTNTSMGDSLQSQWSFGDGVTSTLDSPTHTYTTPGSYTVTLAVNGPGGVDTLTRTNYITVYAPSRAGFTAFPSLGVTPMTVVFTNTSTGDYSTSLWNFGDNLTSPLSSPTHTYTTKGIYTVTLMVSGPGGVDTITRTNCITAYEPVQANFTAGPVSGSVPLTTVFTNTSTGDYTESLWSLGDGTISTLQNPTHTYTATGVYTVGLTVIKRLGTLVLPGHISTLTRTQYITVYAPVQPVAGFTAAPISGIRPLGVNFTDTSTGTVSTWLWNFGDEITSTKQHPTHTYTVAGVYTVTLTASGPSGSDTESKTSFITVRHGVHLPIVLREYFLVFGRALSLDGVDDYASALDSASLDLGTGDNSDFTIETFFYVPDLTRTGDNILILKPGAYGLYVTYNTSAPDRPLFRIWSDPSNFVDLHYNVNLSVGWHHIAAVFDNENTASQDLMALYLDGSLVASSHQADWTSGLPDSTSALNIGAYLGVSPTVGWVEEMRFSDIVRYSGTLYTVPTISFVDDDFTHALWHFDEAPGSTIFADSSGNGNTLTGRNGAHTGSP